MNEYLYEEQLKNEKFEMLVNTKEKVDFVISWDADEYQNMFYLNENEFLNLNVYSEHDHEKRQYEFSVN